MESTPFLFGLKLSEFATLIGIVIGPIAAVCISLLIERRRKLRDDQTQVLRALLATRATPGDVSYIGAINLVPVYFNRREKVMKAWRDYMDVVRYKPQPEDEANHLVRVSAKQTALIFSIMQALGLSLSETEIQTEGYLSTAFVARDTTYMRSLEALPQMAEAAKRSADAAEAIARLAIANAQGRQVADGR